MLGILILQLVFTDYGMASVYNDKKYACPQSTYKNNKLPTCANRELPCGIIINVKRVDNEKIAQCRIIDRGPFGTCEPSKKNTRACGFGSKWKNGRKLFKTKRPLDSIAWRGILDMSPRLARMLGVKRGLTPVVIYTELANNVPSTIIQDSDSDHGFSKNVNDFNILTSLDGNNGTSTTNNKERNQEVAQDFRN